MTTWVSCSSRRLFDGSFWLDQTVLSVNNTMPRAGRPSSRAAFEATKFLLHFSSYNLMAGGRVEHGRRPLLKPVRVGLREQGCVAGAVCFTCNKGKRHQNREHGPTCLRHFSGLGRKLCRQPDRSARSDRLFQTLLFWILRVCAARSH
jgi:hypothetical protein